MDNPLEVGKTYRINSSRKGNFTARLTRIDETFATGTIVSGYAAAMMPENEREVGEEVTVRLSLCTFREVPQP